MPGTNSHKCPGTDGNILGIEVIPATVGGEGGVSFHGQHGTQLYKQTE